MRCKWPTKGESLDAVCETDDHKQQEGKIYKSNIPVFIQDMSAE